MEGDAVDVDAWARFAFSLFVRTLYTAESNGLPVTVGHRRASIARTAVPIQSLSERACWCM